MRLNMYRKKLLSAIKSIRYVDIALCGACVTYRDILQNNPYLSETWTNFAIIVHLRAVSLNTKYILMHTSVLLQS